MVDDQETRDLKILAELSKPIEPAREAYFKSVIEFLKWTTTFAFAALIWISSNYQSKMISLIFLKTSLLFLIFSIIVSMYTVYSVVFYWGASWNNPLNFYYSCAKDMKTKFGRDEKANEKLKQYHEDTENYLKIWIKKYIPSSPHQFNRLLLLHLILLLIGSVLYVAGVFSPLFNS